MYFNMFFLENELYKLSKMNKIKVLGDVLELVRLICHKNNKAHSEIISSHCTMCIVYIVVQTSQVCVVSLLIFIEKVCAMKDQYQFQDRRNDLKFGWDIPLCFAESAPFGWNRVNVTTKRWWDKSQPSHPHMFRRAGVQFISFRESYPATVSMA